MALWTPANSTSPLWLDGSDSTTLYNATTGGSLVASDGSIARWEDKSGNGRHVTQSTLANRPLRKTSVLNGLDVVRFDGVNDLLETTFSSFGSSHYSIAIVRASNFTTAIGGIFVCRSKTLANPINPQISFNTGVSQYAIRDDAGSVNSNSISGLVDNTWYSLSGLRDGSNVTTYRNGVPGVTGTNAIGTATTGVTSVGALYSGGSFPNSWVNGDIAEIVVVPALYRLETEGYIHWKWGLQASLPSDHPYKNAAPRTGIARPKINGSLLNRGLINGSLLR